MRLDDFSVLARRIADYERRRSRLRGARVRALIVRLCAGRITGPDSLMAA